MHSTGKTLMHIENKVGYECHLPWSQQPAHTQQLQESPWSSSQSNSNNKHKINTQFKI